MNQATNSPTPTPPSPPVAVRPIRMAASLIVLRDGPAGLEVLMLRRAEKEADQNSGASVFPGGVIDTHDPAMHDACSGLDDAAASERLAVPENGLDYYVAAVRECFEEAGLLFASDADGRQVALDELPPDELAALRLAAEQGSDALLHVCSRHGWRLAVDRLAYISHWLTPPGMPRRFDTRFFVALAPEAQTPNADERETVECLWLQPADALSSQRGLKLMNVTRRILEQLQSFDSAQACMDHARGLRSIPMIMPRLATGKGGSQPVNPWEPAYAEVGRIDPDGHGQSRCELAPGVAVRLSPHVIRVTAPGEAGRNSYLVGGGARNEWASIDAAHGDEAHRAALLAAAPGPVRWSLSISTEARAAGDAVLCPGETLDLGGLTLKALQAGAEGSNDLCLLLEEEKTLFSGNCPEPRSALPAEDIDWLAPAHGFLLARAEPMPLPVSSPPTSTSA